MRRLVKTNAEAQFGGGAAVVRPQRRLSFDLPEECLPPKLMLEHVRSTGLPDLTQLTDRTCCWLDHRLPLCGLTGKERLRKPDLVTSYAGSLEFLRQVERELAEFLRGVAASQIRLRVEGAANPPSHW